MEDSEPDLPSWADKEGMHNGYFYAVGVAEGSANASPVYLKRAAKLDAESQLFSKAPHEYREVVQNAVDSMNVEGSNFKAIQTKLLRLHGVTGVLFPRSKSKCYKVVRDNGEYAKVRRVCYVQAKVDVLSMNKTIERVVQRYYGEKASAEFNQLLNSELEATGVNTQIKTEKRKIASQINDQG